MSAPIYGHIQVPAEAPTPLHKSCEWRHTTEIREGDLVYMGDHILFGEREAFFHRVAKIEEKPKTFTVTLVPTHPRLVGSEQRRWRKDEFLLVRRAGEQP